MKWDGLNMDRVNMRAMMYERRVGEEASVRAQLNGVSTPEIYFRWLYMRSGAGMTGGRNGGF
jgi:hypothetical protein